MKNDLDDPPNRVIVIQHTVLFRRKHLILKDHLMINKTVRKKNVYPQSINNEFMYIYDHNSGYNTNNSGYMII